MTFDQDIKATVRTIPDYPKKGILFRDITTLLADARAFRRAVDDLIATGGTAEGAVKLLRQIGANVVAACFIIDLPDLGGADKLRKLDVPVRTLMAFEGH